MVPGLNHNELEVLRILWQCGEQKPAEIGGRFGWAIDNGTLRSVLVTLVDKGHVVRDLRGKAYFYRAKVPKRQLLQRWMRSMVRIFAGGSPGELMAQLVQTGDLRAADLERLRRLARGDAVPADSRGRPRPGGRRKGGDV
jgi:predicted transcriptional regulator